MVRPDCDEAQVAAGLLEHSEAYLQPTGGQGHLRRRNPPLERLLPRPVRGQRVAGRAGVGQRGPTGIHFARLSRNRSHAVVPPQPEHVRGGRRSPADAGSPADGRGSGARPAAANLVGGLHAGPVRPCAFRVGSAERRLGGGDGHFPPHGARAHHLAAAVAGADRGLGGRVGPSPRPGDLPPERGLPPVHPRGHPRGRGPGHAAQPGRPGPLSQDGLPAVRTGERVPEGQGISI